MVGFIIWAAGYIAAYFFFRWGTKKMLDEGGLWTVGHRAGALVFSILSWAFLLFCAMFYIVLEIRENADKPAKW